MAEVIVNFKGADPVAGGPRYDRVPEGTYRVKCSKADSVKTQAGKSALTVTLSITKGPMRGKKVSDWFVLPRKGTGDSIFAIQRLHGYMVACGIKRQNGKVPLDKIARILSGRECVAEIADNLLGETDTQKARTISSPQAYYSAKSKEGIAALKARKPSDEEEDEDEDEEDEEVEDEEEEDEEDEEEEEKPKARKKSPKTKKAKRAKQEEDEEEEDDEGLYDDEDEDEDEEDED